MPYSIDKYNGTTVAVVEDGTIDSTLDIKLIGKNYAGYGEVQNENFVHLLENFAGANQPPRPISGQIWYDSSVKKLKFYDATTARWKTTGGAEVSSSAPAGLSQGDFWYDSTNKQIYVYDGASFILVGPQGVAGLGTTQMKSITLVDDDTGASHAVIQAFVDGQVVFIISSDEFTLDPVINPITGFDVIKKGITLVNTDNSDGITDVSSEKIFWGTASSAKCLIDPEEYPGEFYRVRDFVLKTGGGVNFDVAVHFSDAGYYVGDDDDLEVKIDVDGITPVFKTTLNDTVKFKTYNSSAPASPHNPLNLVAQHILPGIDSATNLGSSTLKFNNIYGNTFSGTAAQSDKLKLGSEYKVATVDTAGSGTADSIVARDSSGRICASGFLGNATSATTATTATQSNSLQVEAGVYRTASVDTAATGTGNSIACRDTDGNLNAVLFQGTATSAFFADLAEKYLPDAEYEIGTVVVVGGSAEITACSQGDRAFGAISGSPAFMMNSELEGGVYVALKGRVPVKVIGSVKKGDKLIAADNGCAGVAEVLLKNITVKAGNFPDTFAIALETSDDEGIKLVEAIIL